MHIKLLTGADQVADRYLSSGCVGTDCASYVLIKISSVQESEDRDFPGGAVDSNLPASAPGMVEPGGLPSMGLHSVGHD